MESSSTAGYIEAFTKMRSGALLMIIGSLLAGLGVVMILFSMMALAFPPGHGPFGPFGYEREVGTEEPALTLLVSLALLILVGSVISLIGMFAKFIPGVSRLAGVNPEFSTAATLIKIGYLIGLILFMLGALTLIILIGVLLIIVAAIFMFIGTIGLIILCFNLNNLEKNTLYLAAAILFIIGIFVSVASFVGWILLYIALGHSISKRTTPAVPGPVISQPL